MAIAGPIANSAGKTYIITDTSGQAPATVVEHPSHVDLGLTKPIENAAIGKVTCGSNSVVECKLPKLDVAGSIPVSRSKFTSVFSPPQETVGPHCSRFFAILVHV